MLPFEGDTTAPILVVCDAPSAASYDSGYTMPTKGMDLFAEYAERLGFGGDEFVFVSPCPPLSERDKGSDARERDHLKAHRDAFMDTVSQFEPRCIVTLGKLAVRQVANKAIKITRVRGTAQEYPDWPGVPVLPMISPAQVIRFPDNAENFRTGFHMLSLLKEHEYDLTADPFQDIETHYAWANDIQFLLDKVDAGEVKLLSVDCEATGLDWYRPEVYPITTQLCWGEGQAVAVPVDLDYWNAHCAEGAEMTQGQIDHVVGQLKALMEDPRVQKMGHNAKIDHHYLRNLGINVTGWSIDTLLFAFLVDENMPDKSLAECVRRWVPSMRGYSDQFDATTDKSRMIDVPLDPMLQYGCGDVDATLRLAKVLYPLVRKDDGQWNCYKRVMLPTISAFMDVVEPYGMHIDTQGLADLQQALDVKEREDFSNLLKMVPRRIRRRHIDKGLKFTRGDFVRDILFSEDGLALTPRVFTKSTQALEEHERVPSTSAKDHLPYFEDEPFVASFMNYQRLAKMRSTYVGEAATEAHEATGFWKYIYQGKIHPSFSLHRTVTGRSSSSSPNAQNFPKRGKGDMASVVKAFRRVFKAPPGWKLIEADLSQAELRIAAWMSGDRTMVGLYQRGADIHAMTAATTMGMDLDRFYTQSKEVVALNRFRAKAVNFGFCLPGSARILTDQGQVPIKNVTQDMRVWDGQEWVKHGGVVYKGKKNVINYQGVTATPDHVVWTDEIGEVPLLEAKVAGLTLTRSGEGAEQIAVDTSDADSRGTQRRLRKKSVDRCSREKQQKELANHTDEVDVFDIIDAGPRNRFTASDCLVHNCYGMWWRTFKVYAKTDYGLDLTDQEAQRLRTSFFNAYSALPRWHEQAKAFATKHGYIKALHGAVRHLPNINSPDEGVRRECERQAINSPVQRFASDLGLIALGRLARDCPLDILRPIAFIHDALICLVREDYAEEGGAAVQFYMESPPLRQWFGLNSPVPILADVSIGDNLADMDEIKDCVPYQPSWYQPWEDGRPDAYLFARSL